MKYISILFLTVCIISCGKFPSDKQRQRYETVQKELNEKSPLDTILAKNDSAAAIFNLVKTRTLDEFISETNINSAELDRFLQGLEITVGISGALNSLKSKLKESDEKIDEAKRKLDSFHISKMEPVKFTKDGRVKEGDSMKLKVMIAAYDSTSVPFTKYNTDKNKK
jgi:hypothetical protein